MSHEPTKDNEESIEKLNEECFVILNYGNKPRVGRMEFSAHPLFKNHKILNVTSFDDFRNQMLNRAIAAGTTKNGDVKYEPLAKIWLAHPKRRQYKQVVFAPGSNLGDDYMNLWQGFSVTPKAGNCDLYLAHLHDNICDRDDVLYAYLMNWFARAVQFPNEQGYAALVWRSDEGTGKNVAAEAFGKLFGPHYMAVSNARHLTGNFNAHLQNKLVLLANEAFQANNKQDESVLKMLITDPTIVIESKGVNVVDCANLLHLIISSNADWVVSASDTARRFVVFEVSNEKANDYDYFGKLKTQLEDGGYEALLDLLLKRDISKFNPRDIPHTAALAKQKEESATGVNAVWLECLKSGILPGTEVQKKDGIWMHMRSEQLAEWAEKRNSKNFGTITESEIGYFLKGDSRLGSTHKGMGIKKQRIEKGGNRQMTWIVPPLVECRKRWDVAKWPSRWPAPEAGEDDGKDITPEWETSASTYV
jgi:hypothetical protein